jgi:hypothetical protein
MTKGFQNISLLFCLIVSQATMVRAETIRLVTRSSDTTINAPISVVSFQVDPLTNSISGPIVENASLISATRGFQMALNQIPSKGLALFSNWRMAGANKRASLATVATDGTLVANEDISFQAPLGPTGGIATYWLSDIYCTGYDSKTDILTVVGSSEYAPSGGVVVASRKLLKIGQPFERHPTAISGPFQRGCMVENDRVFALRSNSSSAIVSRSIDTGTSSVAAVLAGTQPTLADMTIRGRAFAISVTDPVGGISQFGVEGIDLNSGAVTTLAVVPKITVNASNNYSRLILGNTLSSIAFTIPFAPAFVGGITDTQVNLVNLVDGSKLSFAVPGRAVPIYYGE